MTIEIELSSVVDAEQLHDLLEKELSFVDGYGKNWDAFWDCISDPGLAKLPSKIVFKGTDDFKKNLAREYFYLRDCFNDLRDEHPEIECTVQWV